MVGLGSQGIILMKKSEYWALAQAIAWVCTQDEKAFHEIKNPDSLEALSTQILKYRQGERVTFRFRVEGPPGVHRKPLDYSFRESGPGAMDALVQAILSGKIHHLARHAGVGCWAPIPEGERIFLQFRIHPDDPDRPYGFGSKDFGVLKYLTPRLSIQDVKRLYPAPRQAPTILAEHLIGERLLEITAARQLTKQQAMDTCNDVKGYYRSAFERAWRKLPPERKVGRGKHGPRVHPSSGKPRSGKPYGS
jgi:hypothetical protein